MPAPRPAPPGLDIQGLLTIDVAAELRKLSLAQLQGPWQLPAELVRRAIRTGATQIGVSFTRDRVVISDDGPGLDPSLVQWTAIVVDRKRSAEERHLALTTLERAGELGLLALAGLEPLREVAIHTIFGNQHHVLAYQAGQPASVEVGRATRAAGTQIIVRAGGLDRRRAARWIADVARFAPVAVVVDGRAIPDGMADSLLQAPLQAPLRGRLALLLEGDTAHACLLANGLVSAHLSIPDAPCFEAAVELASVQGELSPARLRDAIARNLPALIDQAVALIVAGAAQAADWPHARRARLAHLTLQAARRKLRPEEIERAAVFQQVGTGGPALVDLATLRRAATTGPGGPGTLLALDPGERPERYAVGLDPVLIADDAERSLLAEVLGVRFRTPNRQEAAHTPRALVRRLLRGGRRLLAQGLGLLLHPSRRPALPDHVLSARERAFLTALREHLRDNPVPGVEAVALCPGGGPLRRPHGTPPLLHLPRDNATVSACLRAFSSDPRWVRLIHLALTGAVGRSG